MATHDVAPTPGRIRLPFKQPVEDLLLWRDVKKTGAVFGGATLVFLIFQFSKINFLSLTLYALSAMVFAMLAWSVLGGVLKRPPPPLPKVLKEGVREAEVRAVAERVTPLLNKALSLAYRALRGAEPQISVAVGGGLYLVAKLTSYCSLLALAYIPVALAFTGPKLYEMRKDDIDRGVAAARTRTTDFYNHYLAGVVNKIPRAAAPTPASSSTARKLD